MNAPALVLIALYAGSAFLIVGFIVTLAIFLIAYEDSMGSGEHNND